MTKIQSSMLNDTLNLVQLARETALARGKQAQAQRLSPVVDELKTLVSTKASTAPAAPSATMQQGDFKTLLAAASKSPAPVQAAQSTSSGDRNRMVLAMAAGNMGEVDIARQMGMTTDEVRLVVSASRKGAAGLEMKK
jgi:hypothetical protein